RKARPRLHPWLHSIRHSAKLCEPPPRSIALSLTLTLEQPRLPPTWKKSCSKPILATKKRLPASVTFMLIASNSSRHHLTGNEFRWFLLACPAAISRQPAFIGTITILIALSACFTRAASV